MYRLTKRAALSRQKFYAKLHQIQCWWFWSWRHICGCAVNRRNRRKPTPHERGNSPKSGDDRIDQVFCLRHREFDRVFNSLPCSQSGWSKRGPPMIRDTTFLGICTIRAKNVKNIQKCGITRASRLKSFAYNFSRPRVVLLLKVNWSFQ